MAEATLANLCKICNNYPPKYTCPRCSSRTCSLACYKKHQARAQCSGKRDPTLYKRRNELATPSNIDHDFNFLTSIERAIDHGGKVAQKPLEGSRSHNASKERSLEQFIAEQDILLHKAPKGLSRQRENSTHWVAKSKCVMWTIEWFLPDSSRVLRNGRDTVLVKDLFRTNFSSGTLTGQKRKRNVHADANAVSTDRETDTISSLSILQAEVGSGIHHVEQQSGGCAACEENEGPETREANVEVHSAASEALHPELHFYMVKPQTICQSRVLQPLNPDQPLRNNLQGKILLEFPSIQVLTQKALELPAGFILEDEYREKYQAQVQETNDHVSSGDTNATLHGDFEDSQSQKRETVPDQKVVDSVLRDVAG